MSAEEQSDERHEQHAALQAKTTGELEHSREKGRTQDPEELQAEIAETRDELGETVEALARKADLKGQAQEKLRARSSRWSRPPWTAAAQRASSA